jgi:ComF family protein
MKILKILIRTISPISCLLCSGEGVDLCAECVLHLPKREALFSAKALSLFSYQDQRVKKILRDAKYHHRKRLYEPLVHKLVQENTFLMSFNPKEVLIIHIPTHPLRSLFRGQDHTKTITSILSKKTGIPCAASLLQKKKRTKRQALLTKNERHIAQKNSFSVLEKQKDFLSGKEVLLVDDIITTGSTVLEAKKTLLAAGAKEVHLFALAH